MSAFAALSLMVAVPLVGPTLVALKVISMLQLAPAAKFPTQWSLSAKEPVAPSPAATPTLLIESVAVPELVIVTVCAALVVPTSCGAKVTFVVDSDTAGAGAEAIENAALVSPLNTAGALAVSL